MYSRREKETNDGARNETADSGSVRKKGLVIT